MPIKNREEIQTESGSDELNKGNKIRSIETLFRIRIDKPI